MSAYILSGNSSALFNRERKKFRTRRSPSGVEELSGSSGFSCRPSRPSRGALLVVAGLAGAGKTELLARLEVSGEQVLDLEGLACHRGSAFGAIGIAGRQPTQAAFARAVAERVEAADREHVLWVEDEGPFIGSVGVPPELAAELRRAPVVELRTPFEERVSRLVATYGSASEDTLLAALERSRRRLGDGVTDEAAAYLRDGDVRAAVGALLPWFDRAYRRRIVSYGRRDVLAVLRGPRVIAR